MKKSILAVAIVAGFATSVQAASVKVYGRLDTGLASISGAGANDETLSGLAYGPLSSSRWGVKGKEDLIKLLLMSELRSEYFVLTSFVRF